MHGKRLLVGVLGVAMLLVANMVFAQAFNSTLSGRVINENAGLPGVTVTAKARELIGTRTTVTGSNGDYVFANLPGGDYTVTFEMSSFQAVTKTLHLGSSQSLTIDTTMSISGVTTSVEVAARSETVSTGAQQSTTYTADTMSKLPVARTILAAVQLSPGVNTNGPNGAVTISGAQSFDNLFTVNGVVVNDNIRGTPNTLFIEDAIQETTTSTSAVSAEYGRFSGGVVNTVTKSGGNVFSGSFRTSLTNPAWSAITPAKETASQTILPVYEATLGGPFWRDHIWFFGAYRSATSSTATQTSSSSNGAPQLNYNAGFTEQRYEGKLTLSPFPNHTFTGNMVRIDHTDTNYAFTPLKYYDQASIYDRQLPQEQYSGNYNGVITSNFFVEAQYSSRKFTFENSGSRFNDLIQGTVLHDRTGGGYYNSPIFCAICPGSAEIRSNEDYTVKGTYFLSTGALGSHNIVLGYDHFTGSRLSNNFQSGSSYFIAGTNAIFKGGDIFPTVDANTYLGFYPIPNVAQPSKVLTHSGFLNDTWRLNNNLSFNLGVRYDKNNAADSKGAVTANDSAFSPRLSASFDPTGTGALRFSGSYARYVGQVQETQVGATSSFGAPAAYYYYWSGPPLNGACTATSAAGTCMTRAQIIQAVFDYYGITGLNQFPSKHADDLAGASVPGVNTSFLGQSLKSPHTDEFSVGMGGQIGSQGSFRVDGIYRKSFNFYNDYVNMGTGQVTDSLGNVYDLQVINNLTDPLSRKYYGMNVQFNYRPVQSLSIGGNWTWSHTYGNFVGETTGSGPVQATVQQYPEYKQQSWNFPTGDLQQDERHRVRIFGTLDMPVPKAMGLWSISAIQAYDSGLPYGAIGAVRSRLYVTNPGYSQRPNTVGYYYSSRDAFNTPSVKRTDLALNWSYKFGGLVELFIQPQIINVLNYQQIATNIGINSSMQDATTNSRLSDFNPFTTTPVQFDRSTNAGNCPNATSGKVAANYCLPAGFGAATSNLSYQQPRTFRISAGIRF